MAQNILTATIKQLDASGVTLATRIATMTDSAPVVGDFRGLGVLIDTSQATIGLPTAQVRQVFLRNTHASALITVVWTPNGGAQATIIILGPGDGIGFWHQSTGATKGISSLKLTSDTANATYELYLGG